MDVCKAIFFDASPLMEFARLIIFICLQVLLDVLLLCLLGFVPKSQNNCAKQSLNMFGKDFDNTKNIIKWTNAIKFSLAPHIQT